MYDVAIVGGGPAGCAVALRLRQRGRHVVMIDKQSFPRDKPCGEGMLPTGVAVLDELGLADSVRAIDPPVLDAIEFVIDGHVARGKLPSAGAGLDRRRFDQVMACATRDAGVTWLTGVPRVLERDSTGSVRGIRLESGRRIEAALVIGADGLRSWVRRELGLNTPRAIAPRYGLCSRVVVPHHAGHHVEVHVVPGVGELYVTPTGPHQLSIALLADRPNISAIGARLSTAVRVAIARAPSLARRLAGATVVADRALATGPLASRAMRPWGAGALLAGDAALAIDPIGGDGMTLALVGSQACATAAEALLDRGNERETGERYASAIRDASRRRGLFVAGLLALTARPRIARPVIRALALAPGLLSAVCAMHEGLSPAGVRTE